MYCYLNIGQQINLLISGGKDEHAYRQLLLIFPHYPQYLKIVVFCRAVKDHLYQANGIHYFSCIYMYYRFRDTLSVFNVGQFKNLFGIAFPENLSVREQNRLDITYNPFTNTTNLQQKTLQTSGKKYGKYLLLNKVKNIVSKGESACCEQFIPFATLFSSLLLQRCLNVLKGWLFTE